MVVTAPAAAVAASLVDLAHPQGPRATRSREEVEVEVLTTIDTSADGEGPIHNIHTLHKGRSAQALPMLVMVTVAGQRRNGTRPVHRSLLLLLLLPLPRLLTAKDVRSSKASTRRYHPTLLREAAAVEGSLTPLCLGEPATTVAMATAMPMATVVPATDMST